MIAANRAAINGLLSVSAREQSTGIEACVMVKPSYGLEDARIASMLEDSYKLAGADMKMRMLREAQVSARQLIDATEAALADAGEALLSPPERMMVTSHIYMLADIIETGSEASDENIAALKSATDSLNDATQEFAARRMNASVQRALSGHRIDQIADQLSQP